MHHTTIWLLLQRSHGLTTSSFTTMALPKASSHINIKRQPDLLTRHHTLSMNSLLSFQPLPSPVPQCLLPQWGLRRSSPSSTTRGIRWDLDSHPAMSTQQWQRLRKLLWVSQQFLRQHLQSLLLSYLLYCLSKTSTSPERRLPRHQQTGLLQDQRNEETPFCRMKSMFAIFPQPVPLKSHHIHISLSLLNLVGYPQWRK